MFEVFKVGYKEHTKLSFNAKEDVINFLSNVYCYVNETKYNDGSLFYCKTFVFGQYRWCEWVMLELSDEGESG